eukprot:TRINITY_DN229_c1_g1_i1.p2 TRINITY_DN229_c1_g1~~TRINITY_DN229_c1_g1_i1.p2  ORF type:complete len:325 (+),score=102.73 TRINITY_DN229_c1_g1_i1:101-1075(+)
MSRAWAKPWHKNKAPYQHFLSFKEQPENRAPVDYAKSWRSWQAFKLRTNFWRIPQSWTVIRSDPGFRQQQLRMPEARAWQRQQPKVYRPDVRIDPNNPYRPQTEWPEAIADDAPLTQFHQRYEYPYIAIDPWSIRNAGLTPTPTGRYWRPPEKQSWIERGLEHPHDPHPFFFGLTYCILLEPVPDLGDLHDVVAVHPEQFRQELHPNKLAVVATRENCTLLGVHWDPLYQDYPRREKQGKLMDRQPWVWDQLQGMPWEQFTAQDAEEETERDKPWDGEIPAPKFKADIIAEKKAFADQQRAEREAREAKEKERQKGAAAEFFTL